VKKRRTVAILGAGMAGATAARMLADAGLTVQVFDKGRAVGGRMATRRSASLQFDHGAQFMRSRGSVLAARLAAWEQRGIVAPWVGAERWVGVPDMTAPIRDLLAGLSVQSATTITRIRRDDGAWYLDNAGGGVHGPFGAVAITFPAPQTAALLDGSGYALADVERASYAPCWSVMLAAEGGPTGDLIEPREDPVGLIALDASKPGRPEGVRLTIHATADWSRRHLEEPRETITASLIEAAARHLRVALRPTHVEAHRWRYAQVETALDVTSLYDPVLGLGAAGDWCLGARIEAAHDSGAALARTIASDLNGVA
jgi:renalase